MIAFFKTPQLACYGVINRFEMPIYAHVNCALIRGILPVLHPMGQRRYALLLKIAPDDFVSPIYVLSRSHLRGLEKLPEQSNSVHL